MQQGLLLALVRAASANLEKQLLADQVPQFSEYCVGPLQHEPDGNAFRDLKDAMVESKTTEKKSEDRHHQDQIIWPPVHATAGFIVVFARP